MKIAYFLPSLDSKGPIIVVKMLTELLVQKGHIVTVYYFDDIVKVHFNCEIKKISFNDKIDFDYYDILHSHCLRPDIYLVKWKKYIHKAKIVSTLHQDTFQSFKYEYNRITSFFFTLFWCLIQSKFDNVVCISKQIEKKYCRIILTKVLTIYNGCSIEEGNTNNDISLALSKIKEKYHVIGTYAYVTKRKGLEQVINSLLFLPDYAFVIIGDGPEILNLKKIAKKNSVEERVFFFSFQEKPYLYLKYFDLYIMPSYSEGFGLSMVEAALCKRPIVCSNLDSFHEIFPNREAIFFQPKNINDLQMKIKECYNMKELYSLKAYMRVVNAFTDKVMASNYEKLYNSILKI